MLGHPAFELDWNLVRTFVAVARSGSLAAGARDLGMTHPTAARHIQQLESSLGMALFNRTAKGLVLNDAGAHLNDTARVMHKSALAFQAASESMREQPLARVRVSVAEILADMLPGIMLTELRDMGEVPLTIDMVVTNDTVNLLERDVDIALRHVQPDQQELLCRKVGFLTMGVYAHKDYLARYGRLNKENLVLHRFVDGMSRDYLSRGAKQRQLDIEPHQIALRSDSVSCQRAAVQAGWGVGAFPAWMAGEQSDWLPAMLDEETINVDVWLAARPEVRNNAELHGLFSRLGEGLVAQLQGLNNGYPQAATP